MRFRSLRPVAGVLLAIPLLAGAAAAQTSNNMIFHSNLDEHSQYNDIWGYTAPNGDEYALVGTTTGLAVINVVDPKNPYETGFFPAVTSTWRDIKAYDHYAYVVTEGSGGGLMIVDLADPENPVQKPTYTGFSTAHNLYIDTSTGRCYIAGSNLGSGGLRILSLADPENPVEIGSWETAYFHDVMVQNGRAYGSAINVARLYVLDVTNAASISVLGTASGYPGAFTHNAWVTADDNYVMTTDELVGSACRMWDVSNLPTITQTDAYLPNTSTIPHNAHIDGNLAIISHYSIGVRVVDISDPLDIVEVGYYDTYAANDGGGFDGAWGAFPFFETTPGLIAVCDIQTGLWMVEYVGPLGTVAGAVTDAEGAGAPVVGADLEIVESGQTTTSAAAGAYSIQSGAGAATLRASAYGFETKDVLVTIVEGVTTTVDVALDRAPSGSIAGVVTSGGSSIPGARIEIVGTPLTEESDGSGSYGHGVVPVGTYTVRATAFGYGGVEAEVNVVDGANLALDFDLGAAFLVEEFETATFGWGVNGTASTGQWERADPQPTSGGVVQTGDDHTPAPGVNAWITGPLAGASVGTHDVDGGTTVLQTPSYNLTGLSNPRVSYWRWYVTGAGGNPSTDVFTVEMTTDGGGSWIPVESTEEPTPAWVRVDFAVTDFGALTPLTKFRFTAQDTGAGSITEAGLDDFTIYDVETITATGVEAAAAAAGPVLPLELSRSFPNPFRAGSTARLAFTLPEAGPVRAIVHDVGGRRIAVLADEFRDRGRWALEWNGLSADGRPAPAGVYFVKLSTEQGVRTRKAVLLH